MAEACQLCRTTAELQLSHIFPAFVFRWLKKDGPIRRTSEINRRVQDGAKAKLLCTQCEGMLCEWEAQFAQNIFYPLASDSGQRLSYDDWLLKFCVSVSWRALLYMRSQQTPAHFSQPQLELADDASTTWAQFLRGERRHPGKFEHHLLPLDAMEQPPSNLDVPPNINRYLLRGVEMDAAASNSTCFVYSKLGRVLILGFIQLDRPADWVGTKVRVRHGVISPRKYVLPRHFGAYLMERSKRAWVAMDTMSEIQDQKVQAHVLDNADQVVRSDVFRALEHDVRLFGGRAFHTKASGL